MQEGQEGEEGQARQEEELPEAGRTVASSTSSTCCGRGRWDAHLPDQIQRHPVVLGKQLGRTAG